MFLTISPTFWCALKYRMENFLFFLLSNRQKKMLYNTMGTLQALKLSPTSPTPIAAQFSVESFVHVMWQSKLNSTANFQTAVTGQFFTASLVNGRQNVEKKPVYSPRFYHRQCQDSIKQAICISQHYCFKLPADSGTHPRTNLNELLPLDQALQMSI